MQSTFYGEFPSQTLVMYMCYPVSFIINICAFHRTSLDVLRRSSIEWPTLLNLT